MEDGKLSVCPECTQNCYRTHGKDSFGRGSYFFKVMLGDFSKTLRIPPAFVVQLRNQAHEDAILEGPSGQQWFVKLSCTSTGMNFEHGWEKFVSDHSLELGDFLVFKHVCNSHFIVQIFGKSGCEKKNAFDVKNSAACYLNKRNHEKWKDRTENTGSPLSYGDRNSLDVGQKNLNTDKHQAIARHTTIQFENGANQDHAEEDTKDTIELDITTADYPDAAVHQGKPSCCGSTVHPIKKTEHAKTPFTGKKQKMLNSAKTVGRNYTQTHFVSCRRPVTQTERDKTLKAASSFKSSKPSCLIVMKQSHVYQGFWLGLPRRSSKIFKLPAKRIEVILLGPTNKECAVVYLGDRSNPGLSGGWRYFALDNNLEEGDVCIFELINKSKYIFKVHIFRVVEKWTPPKKMEGTKVCDEIGKANAGAKSHFKTIKGSMNSKNDFANNLEAKNKGNCPPDIQEQGKSAKQVIKRKKKGYPSSGSNNTFGATPIIADGKASCRSSPRYARRQNSVEHLKASIATTDVLKSITTEIVCPSPEPGTSLVGIIEDPNSTVELDSNGMTNVMPSRIGTSDGIPSQEIKYEGPFAISPILQELNQETQAVKLDVTREGLEVHPIH